MSRVGKAHSVPAWGWMDPFANRLLSVKLEIQRTHRSFIIFQQMKRAALVPHLQVKRLDLPLDRQQILEDTSTLHSGIMCVSASAMKRLSTSHTCIYHIVNHTCTYHTVDNCLSSCSASALLARVNSFRHLLSGNETNHKIPPKHVIFRIRFCAHTHPGTHTLSNRSTIPVPLRGEGHVLPLFQFKLAETVSPYWCLCIGPF
mmetsp:Transcript_23142/g.53673  ORF Transcript_23142/g.53673 Transcript_23142/m.53673 type:complete len:202 (-) Transcript_23142:124-729(-)